MWAIEDLQAMNPADSRQNMSFLEHVLQIGAATDLLLCEAAAELEKRAGPYVAAFSQLPFSLDCVETFFKVRGRREGVVVELRFTPAYVAFDQSGQLKHVLSPNRDINPEIARITQVIALIRLWNRRATLHAAYLNCISHNGLRNEIIGRVEGWMDMPEPISPLAASSYVPLTAQAFQAEVTRRLRIEVTYAIQTFLRAYSVANIEELPHVNQLYGYFSMLAPGRIACAAAPVPIASGLCATRKQTSEARVDFERLTNLLDKRVPLDDRVLGQLMAMRRLLLQGEPELALIGCVTAIEWFLNESFGERVRGTHAGRHISASISACLRSGVLDFLSESKKLQLRDLSLARNSTVHGPPPPRSHSSNAKQRLFVIDQQFVQDGLFLALDIYRAVNLEGEKSTNAALPIALSAP